jgi:hypothetical protein
MAQAPDETRREIEKTRLRITEAVEELEERAEQSKDLRRQARNYPLEAVLAVFAASFFAMAALAGLLFSLFPSRRTKESRVSQRSASPGVSFEAIFRLIRPILTRASVAAIVTYIRRGRGNDRSNDQSD